MYIELLYSYPNEEIGNLAAGTCVGYQTYQIYNPTKHLESALESKHVSVLEHLPLTFYINGVSRALLSQITRHRHFSFSVKSQRYCEVAVSTNWYVTPESIKDTDCESLYHKVMDRIATTYQAMLGEGIPKEDARMILPNACKTSFIVSMNARAFIEACTKRRCNKAQEEIHILFNEMRNLIRHVYPNVYSLSEPNCKTIGCQEKKPCQKVCNTSVDSYNKLFPKEVLESADQLL